jgi:CNT family concentrative nucleoside transporter
VLAPLAWLMGVPWADAPDIGALIGVKTVLNEFVAYVQLGGTLAGVHDLDPRSIVIATYALAGFANFGSVGIQIGGIGAMAPSRREDLSRLGLRAMVAGSIATFQTACIAAMIL